MEDSPDAVHILANFSGIGTLQLAQLGIPLDFKEYLLSGLRGHLQNHMIIEEKRVENQYLTPKHKQKQGERTLILMGAFASSDFGTGS